MLVYVQIAFDGAGKVKKAVLAEGAEHVVKKADGIFDIVLATSVQIEGERNVCFAGFAFDGCDSVSHGFSFLQNLAQRVFEDIGGAEGLELGEEGGNLTLLNCDFD